eukprot:CFRG3708T1
MIFSMSKYFFIFALITQSLGEEVCFSNSPTCDVDAECQDAIPNTGECGAGAFGTFSTFAKNADGTYTIDVFADAACTAPILSVVAIEGQCTEVPVPLLGNIYVKVTAPIVAPTTSVISSTSVIPPTTTIDSSTTSDVPTVTPIVSPSPTPDSNPNSGNRAGVYGIASIFFAAISFCLAI